jgi:nicotinamidase-related amidase
MAAKLLIIDPQVDFCDIDDRSALPVTGANADMYRLAGLMDALPLRLVTQVIVTLDTHASVGIERTTFWQDATHQQVAPFTEVTEADVRTGKYLPVDARKLQPVINYLHELEHQGRYRLMVWPVHCVLGTRGHNIQEAVNEQIARWEQFWQRGAVKHLKGMNPLTEAYSAVRAEVPIDSDETTQANLALIEQARSQNDWLLVAGEASSHCVKATMEHLFDHFTDNEAKRVVLLNDCMSPVGGFEQQAQRFFEDSRAKGAKVLNANEALQLVMA